MSVSKWAYEPEKCEGDFCIGECDLCNKREITMWIDADECTPLADGDYKVTTKNNREVLMPYTREGGWNTFYTKSGKLVGEDISEFVIRWFNPAIREK